MIKKNRVVITGLGVVSPLGFGIADTFDGLVEKRCGIARIAAFDASRFSARIAAEVRTGDVKDCVPKSYRKATKVMARDIELAVMAAYCAVKDAGLKTKCIVERGEAEGGGVDVDSTRFGANIGAGLICADLTELAGTLAMSADRPDAAENRGFSFKKWGAEGMANLTPLWLLKFLPNMLACHVTIVHDCQAPSNTITCGEASSHLAIGEAFRTIERGAADICICGGAESKINPMGLIRQSLLGRLATDSNDRPAAACRPFDKTRAGMVISEGGGLLILEELERARRRGARIYAEMCGFGAAVNASHWFKPQPDGRGLSLAISKALADAGVKPEEVGLVNAFGVGTQVHDASEAAGIRAALGRNGATAPVLATKGALGNNGAGSGAIDLAVTVMALHRGVIPPALNTKDVDPACGLRVVCGDPADARVNVALSVASALSGGQTAAIVIRRYQG
ncbi:MAG TPA: beta-ketoacyl-[acyl-carrier-protein] synthase family protein [Phycisphaerae bacterium]|nr:beta-ketoacyl-[acyl-carrier-protein] synthase family protein [Phycisphaerae bacterium]